jgi:hypothetical protein
MKKTLIAFMTLAGAFAGPASANLSISPFYILLDANTAGRTDQVRITNTSKERKSYAIKLVNYRQMQDGTYKEIQAASNPPMSAEPFFEFSPHTTDLDPMQTQTIRIKRKVMSGAADGEYVSHLMFKELPPAPAPVKNGPAGSLTIDLRPLYNVTIPVIILKGELAATAEIKYAKVINDKKNPTAEIAVSRKGTKSFYGSIQVQSDGEPIGEISKFRIFAATPARVLKVPLNKKPGKKLSIILTDETTNETVDTQIL